MPDRLAIFLIDNLIEYEMKSIRIFITSILLLPLISTTLAQKKSELFEFKFNGNVLNGLIESPTDQKTLSLVIIVPGSGPTNFVAGNWYSELRSYFVSHGITCCFWDKTGCGKSEGVFDAGMELPIQKSADEIIAAIQELTKLKIPGFQKIGLWGLSRAGWVCPWVIKEYPSIAYWISVSSPDDNDQSVYQLKNNLIFNGRNEQEVRILTDEYWKGETIFQCGGSFEAYCEVTKNMRNDSICSYQAGKTEREQYYFYQKKFLEFGFSVDCETGKVDSNPGFTETVAAITCPVLAIFGEKDSQVNWKNTTQFYMKTIGSKDGNDLTIKTFRNCNHNIQQCITGAQGEDLSEFSWRSCDGYYDAMKHWMISYGFGK
jgi:alpha/beta superfamily hydrolase